MMDILFSTVIYDLGCSTWANSIRLPIMTNIFHELATSYTSTLTVLESTVKSDIESTMTAIEDIIAARELLLN
jgi:hypothetical protein